MPNTNQLGEMMTGNVTNILPQIAVMTVSSYFYLLFSGLILYSVALL